MSNDTSSIPDGEAFDPGPAPPEPVYALIIAWAGEEWARVGEVALFGTPGRAFSVGRDDDSPGGHRRARWMRQRPGENVVAPPLASGATSRDQLLVTARAHGLEVENVGKYPMLVDGARVERAVLEEGALVQIQGQLLLRCIRRPPRMEARRHLLEKYVGPFGEANAFGMVGESPEWWALLERLAFAARIPAHVLIRGETGTGKESAAAAVHAMGPSARGPLVSMSVGNIAPTLLEDELFGHRKGYPQAGMDAKKGVVAEANGGTLFLDEIGNLSFAAQVALLRVLDKGEYRTLGGEGALVSVFRLIGATNREHEALMLDLRKRLSTQIWMPRLAHRRDDVPLILRHLLKKVHATAPELTQHLVTEQADGTMEIAPPCWFVEKLMRQETYEGNVRDLITAVNELLEKGAPPRGAVGASEQAREPADAEDEEDDAANEARGAGLTEEEVKWYLAKTGGNVAAAARHAGVTRPAFYRAMKRLRVTRKEGGVTR